MNSVPETLETSYIEPLVPYTLSLDSSQHTQVMESIKYKAKSFADRRASLASSDDANFPSPAPHHLSLDTMSSRLPTQVDEVLQSRPRGPPTPNLTTPAELDSPTHSTLNHDPPPPPTPAASPGPDDMRPDWSAANDQEDIFLAQIRTYFKQRSGPERTRILGDLLNLCTSQQLSFVSNFVSPLLKKDPFTCLPDELCLRVLSFIDDAKVLARASQVSRRWRDLLSDDITWKHLCEKHDYRRRLSITHVPIQGYQPGVNPHSRPAPRSLLPPSAQYFAGTHMHNDPLAGHSRSFDAATRSQMMRRPQIRSHKSYFKQRYLVETAWRNGGTHIARHITQDQGVVTSLHLTPKYIVVALDNAKIHVFDTDGGNQKTLQGHVMGVWAMVPWGDTLVSGGCDREVRVWDMSTGESKHTLRGHTSTVRCLKMADANTAISGSRDTTLRIWDIRTGMCQKILVGHLASVRCLEIHGDIVVSGSYDTTAKVWSISEGRCLQTLNGHFSQIYAIAFDGKRIATGSLDTSVRIWDLNGRCQAILQGHTSLVGQLQMRGNTLVTGGSDGSVRVWSLERMAPIHRLAAHDNSVTSLQFDDNRVVSGGSDGRVKIWDLKTGLLVRELTSPADAVWRVAFEEEKCVVMASRANRTIMEVWSFSPPVEQLTQCSAMAALPPRPLSEAGYHSRFAIEGEGDEGLSLLAQVASGSGSATTDDIVMGDAGPSTAPLGGNGGERTFLSVD